MYRVIIDREACDGVFACLTRDPRFVEDDDGLATLDPTADPAPPEGSDDGAVRETAASVDSGTATAGRASELTTRTPPRR